MSLSGTHTHFLCKLSHTAGGGSLSRGSLCFQKCFQSTTWKTFSPGNSDLQSYHIFFFLRFFWCGPFVKYWICYSIPSGLCFGGVVFFFFFLVFWPRGMWDLSSPTRDRTHTPCTGRQSFNHWTTRDVPPVLPLAKRFFRVFSLNIL